MQITDNTACCNVILCDPVSIFAEYWSNWNSRQLIAASGQLGIAWANPLKRFEISAIVSWMRKVRVLSERDGVVEVSQTAGHFKL